MVPVRTIAQCNPVTATLYGSADDGMNVYINGNGPIGPINYVTAPGTLPTFGIPGSYFNNGANVIAVQNTNASMSVVEAAWTIDITCSGGVSHAYFSNTDQGYGLYDDYSGGAPPPNDASSNPWYSTSYAAATSQIYFTGVPITVTSPSPNLQVMYNPQTGQVQPWSSTNTAGSSSTANEVLYFRGSFNLNAMVYTPPSFTVQKITGLSSYPISYNSSAPYTLVVCNSGAPVNSAVTIWDSADHGQYNGPYSYYYNPPSQLFSQTGTNPVFFVFPLGFAGNGSCVTIAYSWGLDTQSPGAPCSVTNNAGVSWDASGQAATQVVVPVGSGCGPTNTFTATATRTFSPTFTLTPTTTNTATLQFTATHTATRTPSGTPTLTGTSTPSRTPSATFTVTPTFTQSSTPTNSATVTPSRTPTLTPTVTLTRTPTSTPTVTDTPTITSTPTATVPDTDVFYVSKNAFNPDNDGPVSINVQYSKFPGAYRLWIYNSAGEHILTLGSEELSKPINESYTWDGKNKYGDKCASGVYILYLVEPYSRKLKRVLLLR